MQSTPTRIFFSKHAAMPPSHEEYLRDWGPSCVEVGMFSGSLGVFAPQTVGLFGGGRRVGKSETLAASWPLTSNLEPPAIL